MFVRPTSAPTRPPSDLFVHPDCPIPCLPGHRCHPGIGECVPFSLEVKLEIPEICHVCFLEVTTPWGTTVGWPDFAEDPESGGFSSILSEEPAYVATVVFPLEHDSTSSVGPCDFSITIGGVDGIMSGGWIVQVVDGEEKMIAKWDVESYQEGDKMVFCNN